MRTLRLATLLALAALVASACTDAPKVVQGTVVGYDVATKALTVKNDQQPDQDLVFSLASAEVGAEPLAGDVVRVAFRGETGRLAATRVMNLTRQKEVGKGGEKKH